MDYVGGSCWGNGNEGPPCLKSRCSCELFSPLIRLLSYEMEEGLESPCVYASVRVRRARQEVAERVRDHGSVPTKPEASELGYCHASWNASARAGKVALGF